MGCAARILGKCIILHHFFIFKENFSSDGGLQVSEDEGAGLSAQEDDPSKEGDADSFRPTDHTTKPLDESLPTRGQCCKETNEHKSAF